MKARAMVAHAFGMSMLDMRSLTVVEYSAMVEVLTEQAAAMNAAR